MNVRRSVLAVAMAIGAVLVAASPALAQFGSDPDEPFVVLTGALVVPDGTDRERRHHLQRRRDDRRRRHGQRDRVQRRRHGDRDTCAENVVALNGRVTLSARARSSAATSSRGSPPSSRRPPRSTAGSDRRAASTSNVGKLTAVEPASSSGSPRPSRRSSSGSLLVLFVPRAAEAIARTAAATARGVDRVRVPDADRASRSPRSSRSASWSGSRSASACCWRSGLLYWLGYTAGAYALGRRLVAGPRQVGCWRSSPAGASCACSR